MGVIKKILLTIGDITIKGGAERVVVNLANAFVEYGYDVEILSFYKGGSKESYALDSKVRLRYLNTTSMDNKRKSLVYRLFYKIYESYWLNKNYRDKDFILFNNSPHFPLFKRKNTHYVKIIHTISKGRYLRRYNFFDTLVLVSSRELEFWQGKHKNVLTIPNFLPNIPRENTDYAQKVVLSVGRMTDNDEKGFKRLVEIWNLIAQKDWKLCIVGQGESRDEIVEKIREFDLWDSVILEDFTDKISEKYLSSSVYAMTSYVEGLPMVLLEASSYGLPCVAFDISSGPSDIIENQKSGFLIADGDLQEYARQLAQLMESESLRGKMGESAKQRVQKKFSKEVVIQEWEKFLGFLKI
ncbi:glycosyltransferase family 4 protein [Helicobacter winghamensis]|uniref:glycosyltransferase family 4 protein n=1 Tax=Helicobacter winghamensis TaxID=157268 RepID=UPI0001A28F03|nr:glycosyltransferase family 4 protein [Helicobacter winghamensis]EEO25674.1 glycosyltransferase, group 1 family protein [Helicobacter winghamensis ATCC BAA-430]PKT76699.1 glycosyl transferase family 1 [Helicobacter winghamensis]PKT76819.1 glycosyl transferase family 1 [Helicobacter winghamensis]